jgi:hypothetical protein
MAFTLQELRLQFLGLAAREPVECNALFDSPGELSGEALDELIEQALPELHASLPAGTRATLLKGSGENVVVRLGETHIVKILDAGSPERCATETLLQELLHERVGRPVPKVTHISDTHCIFAMEALPGKPLSKLENSLSEEKLRVLDRDTAAFAAKVTGALSMDEARALELPGLDGYWGESETTLDQLEQRASADGAALESAFREGGLLDGAGAALARGFIDRFRDLAAPAFRREDHHDDNILVDPKTGRITGLIDFGYASMAPKYRLDSFYRDTVRYQDGNWRVAHRVGAGPKRPSAEELVAMARAVAEKYRTEHRVPAGEDFLLSLGAWMEQKRGAASPEDDRFYIPRLARKGQDGQARPAPRRES